jgi:TatD DNase family protein
VVQYVPLECLLVETDAPYLAPQPHRGKRNEPAYVAETAARIAELKGLSYEEVASRTTANAKALFGLSMV